MKKKIEHVEEQKNTQVQPLQPTTTGNIIPNQRTVYIYNEGLFTGDVSVFPERTSNKDLYNKWMFKDKVKEKTKRIKSIVEKIRKETNEDKIKKLHKEKQEFKADNFKFILDTVKLKSGFHNAFDIEKFHNVLRFDIDGKIQKKTNGPLTKIKKDETIRLTEKEVETLYDYLTKNGHVLSIYRTAENIGFTIKANMSEIEIDKNKYTHLFAYKHLYEQVTEELFLDIERVTGIRSYFDFNYSDPLQLTCLYYDPENYSRYNSKEDYNSVMEWDIKPYLKTFKQKKREFINNRYLYQNSIEDSLNLLLEKEKDFLLNVGFIKWSKTGKILKNWNEDKGFKYFLEWTKQHSKKNNEAFKDEEIKEYWDKFPVNEKYKKSSINYLINLFIEKDLKDVKSSAYDIENITEEQILTDVFYNTLNYKIVVDDAEGEYYLYKSKNTEPSLLENNKESIWQDLKSKKVPLKYCDSKGNEVILNRMIGRHEDLKVKQYYKNFLDYEQEKASRAKGKEHKINLPEFRLNYIYQNYYKQEDLKDLSEFNKMIDLIQFDGGEVNKEYYKGYFKSWMLGVFINSLTDHNYKNILYLSGQQGIAKTPFITALCDFWNQNKNGSYSFDISLFTDNGNFSGDVLDKETKMSAVKNPLAYLAEKAFRYKEINNLKNLTGQKNLSYFKKYSNIETKGKKRMTLILDCNEVILLNDHTGNTRFLICPITGFKRQKSDPYFEQLINFEKVWIELYHLFITQKMGIDEVQEFIDKDFQNLINNSFTSVSMLEERFLEVFDTNSKTTAKKLSISAILERLGEEKNEINKKKLETILQKNNIKYNSNGRKTKRYFLDELGESDIIDLKKKRNTDTQDLFDMDYINDSHCNSNRPETVEKLNNAMNGKGGKQ